jgi:hypothetical protein
MIGKTVSHCRCVVLYQMATGLATIFWSHARCDD